MLPLILKLASLIFLYSTALWSVNIPSDFTRAVFVQSSLIHFQNGIERLYLLYGKDVYSGS